MSIVFQVRAAIATPWAEMDAGFGASGLGSVPKRCCQYTSNSLAHRPNGSRGVRRRIALRYRARERLFRWSGMPPLVANGKRPYVGKLA